MSCPSELAATSSTRRDPKRVLDRPSHERLAAELPHVLPDQPLAPGPGDDYGKRGGHGMFLDRFTADAILYIPRTVPSPPTAPPHASPATAASSRQMSASRSRACPPPGHASASPWSMHRATPPVAVDRQPSRQLPARPAPRRRHVPPGSAPASARNRSAAAGAITACPVYVSHRS